VHGNVCVVCKATIQSEEDFIIHSQQHSSSTVHQVSPQNASSGAAAGHAPTTVPCIVCRQTLVSFVELRLHAKHHLQTTQQQHLAPPARSPSSSHPTTPGAADFRSRYVCCVCLGQFDSAESVVPRAGGYFVCVTCNGRDSVGSGMVSFDAAAAPHSSLRPGSTAAGTDPPPRTYQCIKCQESFNSELEVRVHVTCHVINEGNVHECRLCASSSTSPVTFDSPARLQTHIIAEHEFGAAADSSPVVRPCAVCGATLVGPVAARAHAIEHGPSSWPHACQRCPLRFYFAAELRNHQLVTGHYRASVTSAGGSPVPVASSPGLNDDLRCSECSRVFSGYASLCSHRRVHEKPVSVGSELMLVQEMTSLEPLSAGREKISMNGSREQSTPLQCPECSRQFPSLSSLQGHMRVHNSGMLR
jgi:zinc finger protein 423